MLLVMVVVAVFRHLSGLLESDAADVGGGGGALLPPI